MASITEVRDTERFTGALLSDGPAPQHREALMLYGQFVGEWDFEWTGYNERGEAELSERGEWIFAWVLEGRAVQDVWIIPERARRADRDSPAGEYGTTIRFYDPVADLWNVTWHGPIYKARRTFVARKAGDDIVQEGKTGSGELLRWTFSDITSESFRWRSVSSPDGGRSWRPREEMSVHRRS
jgi:hypothetical protein